MAPSFKISFPLPGLRRSSSSPTTPNSHQSGQSDHDETPLHHPGSKAEELLGAATPNSSLSKKTRGKGEKRGLRKFPSFMSVTLADVDGDTPSTEEEFPFPGMFSPSASSANPSPAQQPWRRLSRHGSSPLLGDSQTVTTTDMDYFSVRARSQASRGELSPSVPSEQNKSKMPPSLGQQTSASPTEDLGFQAAFSPVSSPPENDPKSLTFLSLTGGHSRSMSKESKQSNGSKRSASTKAASMPRRRPSFTDPPTLYPDAPRTFLAVSPPTALINSSLPKPMQPGNMHPLPVGKSKWWGKRKASPAPDIQPSGLSDLHGTDSHVLSTKVNVKKPRAGAVNWFDNIDTDDLCNEDASPENLKFRFPFVVSDEFDHNSSLTSAAGDNEMSQEPPPPSLEPTRKSSFHSKGRRSANSDRKLSFKLDSSLSHMHQEEGIDDFIHVQSASGSPNGSRSLRSTESRSGIPLGIDLHKHSILNLSSSDEEEEHSTAGSISKGHRIRASIERADYDNEVLVGSAVRVSPVKPRPVVSRSPRRGSSRRSNSSEPVPPVPQIPSRPQLTQRSSSMRWKTTFEEKEKAQSVGATTEVETGDSTVDSGTSSLNDVAIGSILDQAPSSPRRSKRLSAGVRGSKLIKVTSEEEKLLEAMREKRASIRAKDLQKGLNNAMQQMRTSESTSRPRTAGLYSVPPGGGGGDSSTARSSLYTTATTWTTATTISSNGSLSPLALEHSAFRPHPGAGHVYKNSLGALSRLSASADDLTIEDSYPFPYIASEPLPPLPSFTSIPNAHRSQKPDTANTSASASSPSLSFVPSDMFPSTPSTRDSPLTPPPPSVHTLPIHNGRHGLTGTAMTPPRSSGSGSGDGFGNHLIDNGNLGHGSSSNAPPLSSITSNPSTTGAAVADLEDSSLNRTAKSSKGGGGHERKRTISSTVVVLDGVESHAARWDEENDIVGWAMERW